MNALSSTADDILACARSLVMAGGYNGFSYADIAEVVGIRKASIHHHFPTKVDLVRTLVQRYREDARSGFAALERSAADPLGQLTSYVAYWESCIVTERDPFCICALLASELPAVPEPVAAEVRQHFVTLAAWLISAFERGAASGVLKLANLPKVEAESFMATVHGGMLSARALGDPKLFGTITTALLHRVSS